jgi:hypothetical protein
MDNMTFGIIVLYTFAGAMLLLAIFGGVKEEKSRPATHKK